MNGGVLNRVKTWVGARLQRRMVVTLAAVLILLSAVFLSVLSGLYRARLASEMERAALQISGLLHASLENAMLKRDLPGLRAIITDLGEDPDIVAVRILNPDFEVRFASDPELEGEVMDFPALNLALTSRQPQAVQGLGDTVRAVHPVPNQPRCRECHAAVEGQPVNGLLVVDYAATGLENEARRTMMALMLAGLAVTGASLLASWAVLRRTVLAPLAALGAGTAALAAGRLDHRIAIRGQDEIADLASGFNQMAAGLQEAMAQLEGARAVLQLVIDAIPDAIRVISPDYRVQIANAAYAAHVGLPLEQIIGKPCYQSSHHRESPCIETLVCCPLAEDRAGHLPLTCHQSHKRGAAAEVHVELAAAPVTLMIEGRPVTCVVEAVRDLDQQARLSQEQRLAELGLLSAGLAHEIYNPMSSISLLLDVARHDLAGGRIADAAGRLAVIGQEVGRTLTITNSLLALCLPPSDDAVLIDLDRVVPEALAILGYQARQTGCTIDCRIAPGLRLLGAESDVRMAITNLVLNAIHAMPKGGTVRVTGVRAGDELQIEVADGGIGIAPEHLGRIFLPFWTRRADGSAGRGLGLSIVQAIVARWKGRIEVQSGLGQGSRFTLLLPDPDAPATIAINAPPKEPSS